ncbi:MAG: hypothetical protein ACI82A_000482 [Candidatus Azotimanducaceae bacterium]|jgi:hypothetical protein
MKFEEIFVKRSDLAVSQRVSKPEPPSLEKGQILVEIETIGLSANNVSYAVAGDFLGYWAHFSRDAEWGCVPVWGFGIVMESHVPEIKEGERIFGFFPMASHAVLTPAPITALSFSDDAEHRSGLHPWYKRYYRCANDPAFKTSQVEIQPVLWALFMTGWMLADQLSDSVDGVYISSASSKTALSLAWSLKHCGSNIKTIGITSDKNRDFVEQRQVYSKVVTYEDLQADASLSRVAYVDIAGNAAVTSAAHVMLGDKLVDSILIGSTHRAPSKEALPMPGPTPRFFFIPDVAEERAQQIGFEAYHQNFAKDWHRFAAWAYWLELIRDNGSESVENGYLANLAGDLPPQKAMVYTWK